jgi:cellulose synthase/poly-beta-1,6-N-acetylglucosamine synthase-like glycosyltransferase
VSSELIPLTKPIPTQGPTRVVSYSVNQQPRRTILAKAVTAGRQLLLADPMVIQAVEEVPRHATIGCIITAYNEQTSIAQVLEALLNQSRMPDVIHVIANNCDDDTVDIASKYTNKLHQRVVKGVPMSCRVYVHDMGENKQGKVGALNYGWSLVKSMDFVLGVDGDTILDRHCVEYLELEIVDDTRIGGISAIYDISYEEASGPFSAFLLAGQRVQFGAFNMDNLLRSRQMSVLGGQCSIFRSEALIETMKRENQSTPWVQDSAVEDSLLSVQLKRSKFLTKISARARATVGGMTSMSALHAQQVKWNKGAIELFMPGTRGNIKGEPLNPNLRLRWYENFSMLSNFLTRFGFLGMLGASLYLHAFRWNWIWAIPPVVAYGLGLKVAMTFKNKNWRDFLFAGLFFPAEVYMWIRMGHFAVAWWKFFRKDEKDTWGAQAAAEKGRGGANHLYPLLVAAITMGGATYMWLKLNTYQQSVTLWDGWLLLFFFTVPQTLFMLRKLMRRTRGYKV